MTHYDHNHTKTRMASEIIVAWECTRLPPPLVSGVFIVPVANGKEVCVSM